SWRAVAGQTRIDSTHFGATVSTTGNFKFYRVMAFEATTGSSTLEIHIPVVGDRVAEDTETFFVRLFNPIGATLVNNEASGTIIDNDQCAVSINDLAIQEGNAGTTDAVLTVSLSTPSARTVTVQWATVDGTATAPSDYATAGNTLTF